MKKLFSKSGWLVMAAALLTGMASCSSDEDMVQSSETKSGSSIDVCVKAGFDNDATRSTVVQTTTTGGVMTRDLQFDNGDRLYIWGRIGNVWPDKYLVGFLQLSNTLSEAVSEAIFSGQLGVYENTGGYDGMKLTPSTYDFGDADPLAVIGVNGVTEIEPTATLVHANAEEDVDYTIDENTKIITISFMQVAHDVNTLMTKSLWIRGAYNGSGYSLGIVDYQPIFECTITGAPAEKLELTASYLSSQKLDGVEFGKRTTDFTFTKPAGATSFDLAFVGIPYTGEYHRIQVASEKYGTMVVSLGQTRDGEEAQPLPSTVIKVGNLPWLPNVTNNTTDETISPNWSDNTGSSYSFPDDCNITVRGYSGSDLHFQMSGDNNTITLNGITADCESDYFIAVYNNSNTSTIIDVNGVNNHITCTNNKSWSRAINSPGRVKLRGEGTLTVTSKDAITCGIRATNYTEENNSYSTTTELDVSALLAEDGYTVTRSARTGNETDGYTWTYTVTPNN